jgi:allantoin racemase
MNPNSNPLVTGLVAAAARAAAPRDVAITVTSPADGPFSIETPAHRVAAVTPALRLIERHLEARFDGYVLACFDDIAVPETRALVGAAPVTDLAEAGIAAALAAGGRFTVLTTVTSAVPRILELVQRLGAGERCTIRAAALGVAEAAARAPATRERLAAVIRTALAEDRAETILLGSGALAGAVPLLEPGCPVPIIDPVTTAVLRVTAQIAAMYPPST